MPSPENQRVRKLTTREWRLWIRAWAVIFGVTALAVLIAFDLLPWNFNKDPSWVGTDKRRRGCPYPCFDNPVPSSDQPTGEYVTVRMLSLTLNRADWIQASLSIVFNAAEYLRSLRTRQFLDWGRPAWVLFLDMGFAAAMLTFGVLRSFSPGLPLEQAIADAGYHSP